MRRFIGATLISAGLGISLCGAARKKPGPCQQKCAQAYNTCLPQHRDYHSGGKSEQKKRRECAEKKKSCEASCQP